MTSTGALIRKSEGQRGLFLRKIAFITAMAGGLTSCFDAPFSSTATVTLPEGSTASILTAITDSSGRTSATFDPNANYAQAISASTGAISGTSAIFPPGALSIAVNLLVEEGSDLSGSSTLADLALASSNSVTAAGTTVIIRPSSDAELTAPMSLSIPLPSGFGLSDFLENILKLDDPSERIAVLAKVWDPVTSELKTILIPRSQIKIESGKATFDTIVFGAFQTVLMENPVTTRVEAKASEPVTNVSGTSVVATTGIVEQATVAATESLPALTVKSGSFSFNADSRLVNASITLSESVATTSCTLALRDKAKGVILWSASSKEFAASVVPQISDRLPATIAGYIESAANCTAVDGRNAKSKWEYLGQVCAAGYFGTSCVACAAGTYWDTTSQSCTNNGTGFFSTGDGLRQACTNKPAHSAYSSAAATSSLCAWTCDEPWIAAGNHCAPTGALTGFPSGSSKATTLSGTFSGNGISAYRAKVGRFSATTCADASDYSVSGIASTTPITNNITDLPDGEITVCVVGVDENGVQQPFSSAAHASWVKDTTAPTAPTIVSAAGNTSVTTVIYSSGLLPVINGTAETNATVTIYHGENPLRTLTANSAGAWTYTPSANMEPGTYTITATATDAATNQSSASATVTLVIDNQAPAAPAITGVAGKTGAASAIYTNNLVPAISGTAENNATVSIYNGDSTLGVTTTNGSGAWTYTPSSNLNAGTYIITAKATDPASNQSPASASVTMIIDTTAPAAPIITAIAGATGVGTTPYTKSSMPAIAGTAEANTTVTVYNGDTTLGVVAANGSGAWTYAPSGNLPDGAYTLTFKATDAASNQSAGSITLNLVIDAMPPAAPAITSVAGNTSVASTIYTNVVAPQITGTAEPNAAVMIFNNATFFGTTTASAAGAWSFTSTVNLSAGAYGLTAKAKDAALNEGALSNAVAMNVDTTPPVATISGFPTGTSNTTVLQITVAGTDVTAYKTKSVAGSAILCAATSDYGSETAVGTRIASNISTLADGSVTICVIGRDAAGNWQTEATAANATWTKDTTPPVVTLSGAPSGSSSVASLNVTVGGNGVYLYKFKVGTDTTVDCASATGYGSVTAAATPITASLSAIPAGSWAKLCVLGVDAAENWQTTATSTAWQKACVAGNYPSGGGCAVVGTGYYSTDGLTRLSCSNVPSNAAYSTDNSTTATCPWSCNVNYLLNAAQTGCDYRPNTQAVSCPAGQVIVGAAVRSGGWMDRLGVRCQTFTNGALTGAITDGPAYGGDGGAPYTFDCSAGSYLYQITGGNGTGYYAPQSTFLANIKFYCRSLTTDLSTDTSIQYGGSAGITPFDYSCPVSKPITSIPFDSAGAYVGRILQAYCGSNLK